MESLGEFFSCTKIQVRELWISAQITDFYGKIEPKSSKITLFFAAKITVRL